MTIGKYRIDGEVGRGGFGTVYRAWDPTVGRAVAIKVLTVPGDEDLLTRFRNEAAAQGSLHHPNIVTVHDFGDHEGTPYMVMQLLEGDTLQELLRRNAPLTLIEKMNIMGQVASGLHHAHLHGIVHRDVKPANIMILPDGTVQIMDFGIARLTASTFRQTRTGFIVGTVHYMAPEQFLPERAVDHRADIWAYGVIYYELLTGTHPFAADDSMSVLFKIAHADPDPLHTVAPDYPAALDEVITRLLAKDPDLRYQSLRDVQFDLQPVLLDLKRERAAELLLDARRLQDEEKLEEAQAAAQHILELDPSNREAHTILHAVKARIHRRLIQPKVSSLVQKAEQDVQARAWQLAIQEFEAALRLSNSDPSIHSRLQQVRRLYEVSQTAERMVADAKRELAAENFTAAFRIATEAAQADPGNRSASHVLSQIQRAIDVRESHRRLEEGVAKARGKLLLQQYDDAIRDLIALAALSPGNAAVEEALNSARLEKAENEKRELRRREVAAVRNALSEERFDDALPRLEKLETEYPGDSEIIQLFGFARAETARRARAQAVGQIRSDAERLLSAGQFDAAISLLETALREHQGDAVLAKLLESVALARTEYHAQQRTEAIRAVLLRSTQCENDGDIPGALQIVQEALAGHPDAEPLTAAAARLRQMANRQPDSGALARHVTLIESALAARDYSRALALVEQARREFPGEPALDQLASKAAAARAASELDLARHRIAAELDARRYTAALELARVALKRFPSDSQLLAMEREARQHGVEQKSGPPSVAVGGGAAAAPVIAPTRAPLAEREDAPRPRALAPWVMGAAAVLVLASVMLLLMLRPAQQPQQQTPAAQPPAAGVASTPPAPQAVAPAVPPAKPVRTPSDRPKQDAPVLSRKAAEEVESEPAPPETPREPPARPSNAVVADNTGRIGAAAAPSAGAGPGASGKLVWSGQLAPGDRIVLTDPQGKMPPFTEIVVTSIVPYGRVSIVEVAANGITVANNSTVPVTSIEISWRVKPPQ